MDFKALIKLIQIIENPVNRPFFKKEKIIKLKWNFHFLAF